MCECYTVGGPWIDFDPQCPTHGIDAQRREQVADEKYQGLIDRIVELEEQVAEIMHFIHTKQYKD